MDQIAGRPFRRPDPQDKPASHPSPDDMSNAIIMAELRAWIDALKSPKEKASEEGGKPGQ